MDYIAVYEGEDDDGTTVKISQGKQQRIGVKSEPATRRVIVVLEGESLVNDASALILYRSAIAAAVVGTFSWGESVVRFFLDAGVGVGIGVLVAWLVVRLLRWSRDTMAEVVLTLAAPYVAWLAGETLHVSSVLACVAGAISLGKSRESPYYRRARAAEAALQALLSGECVRWNATDQPATHGR